MVLYKIQIKKSAGKELSKIPQKDQTKIIEKIRNLAIEPRPTGSKKLPNEEKYGIRHGNYRILYKIEDDILIVKVVQVAHRRQVCRS